MPAKRVFILSTPFNLRIWVGLPLTKVSGSAHVIGTLFSFYLYWPEQGMSTVIFETQCSNRKRTCNTEAAPSNPYTVIGHSRYGLPGRVAQSVTCLATDACLTADPGVASSIPARYHTFVEIDHEIISTVILLPSADLFKKGCCQLQAKVCAQITG